MPVHVAHPDGKARFWIAPDLAIYVVFGFSPHVAEVEDIVRHILNEIREASVRHFGR